MQKWQMLEAGTRFDELIAQAEVAGPQEIIQHGGSVAVVLSRAEFDRLTGNDRSLVAFMQQSPLYGLEEVPFTRDHGFVREVVL